MRHQRTLARMLKAAIGATRADASNVRRGVEAV